MKTSVEKIEKNRVELEVELEAEKLAEGMDKAYKKLKNKVNIPGFRKGKVPKPILINYIGKEALYSEAVDAILPEAYYKAVDASGIEPVDQPDLELVQLEENKPLIFKARVTVKPEVELGQYTGLTVEHKEPQVTAEDVENYLKLMQERHAKLVTVEDRPIQKNDTAIIDFEGNIDGEPYPGGKGENYSLEIGSNTFLPQFEEKLIGMTAGEEKEIEIEFPEDYHQENLAGKKATFKINVKEIKKKELLPLDDEFAKDVSDFETLEELKADIEKKLREKVKEESDIMLKNKVLEKVLENCVVEIPDVMIEKRIGHLINEFEQRLRYQGLTLEKYYEISGTNEKELRKEYRERAKEEVKVDLVLEAIAKKEGIDVNDEELNNEIEKMAESYKMEKEKLENLLKVQGTLDSLRNSKIREKTIEFLVKESKIIEPQENEKEPEGVHQ